MSGRELKHTGPAPWPRSLALVRLLDDSRVRRFKRARALARLGYEVIESAAEPASLTGDGACDLLLIEADQAPGALWTLDDLSRLGRAHWPHCAIALLGADANAWPRARLAAAGIDEGLDKSFAPEDLGCVLQAASAARESAPPDAPLLDPHVLDGLERLGGRAFIAELIEQFAQECEALPKALESAALSGDAQAFGALLHALRSAAGNLGASRIFARCLAWRETSAAELARDGAARVAILRADFAQTLVALRAFAG